MPANGKDINAFIGFDSNIVKTVQQINSELRKVNNVKLIDNSTVKDLKKSFADMSSSLRSLSLNGLQKNIEGLNRGAKAGKTTFKEFQTSVSSANEEIEKFGRATGATIRRFSAFVGVVTIFNSIKDAFRSSVSEAISFEKSMNKISQVTGLSIKDLGDLNGEITRLSTSLGVSSKELVNVSLILAQAGISAKDTKIALDVLAKTELSATFENITQTSEGAISAMAQFGTGAKDLAGQLSTVNTISAKFAVESSDLITNLRKAGGAFQATGGSFNELAALFTSVRATTRESADEIATGLRTIFTRLQRPKTLDFLENLGISLRNDKGEFIGVYNAVERLSVALKNVSGSDPRFNQIQEELGGFRQISRVTPLLKEFGTAQKALAAAQRSNNSINEDAIIGQKTLANQLVKVKEEFNAFVRSLTADAAIQAITKSVLNLATAFIRVADSVRPIIPLLTLAAGAFAVKNAGLYLGGIKKDLLGTKPTEKPVGFNRGGSVPGIGSGDTVPAMLEPGEFVVTKKAAQAFGHGNLGKINKYASGGLVKRLLKTLKESGIKSKAQGSIYEQFKSGGLFGGPESDSLKNQVVNPFVNFVEHGLAKTKKFGSIARGSLNSGVRSGLSGIGKGLKSASHSVLDYLLPQEYSSQEHSNLREPKRLTKNKAISNASVRILRDIQKDLGVKFDKSLLNRLIVTSNISNRVGFGNSGKLANNLNTDGAFKPNAKDIVLNSLKINNIKQLKNVLLHELGHAVDLKTGKDGRLATRIFPRGSNSKIGLAEGARREALDKSMGIRFSRDYLKYRYSPEEGFANSFRDYLLNNDRGSDPNHLLFQQILEKASTKKFAKGGGVRGIGNTDNVPALLTPGEFVINKKAAQSFGYGNLGKINKYAEGGKVSGSALAIGAIAGPQILSGIGKEFGLADKSIDSFISSLTLAATSLYVFSGFMSKDTTSLKEHQTELKENLRQVRENAENVITKSKGSREKGLDALRNGPKQELAGTISDLRDRKKLISRFQSSNNPAVAKAASKATNDIIRKMRLVTQQFIKNKPERESNFAEEKTNLITANSANRAGKLKQLNTQRIKIQEEIIKNEKEQLKVAKDSKMTEIVSKAAAAGLIVGGTLSGIADSRISAGQRNKGGTVALSTVGGALSSGATGALVGGSVAGPYGALGGAILGAIVGGFSAFNKSSSELNHFDFTKKFDDFSVKLGSVLNGKSTVGEQSGNINSFLQEANKGFIGKNGDEFQTLKGQVGQSVDALDEYLKKVVALGGSTDDIIKANEALVLVLSRFGNQSIPDVEAKIKKQVELREQENKFVKLVADNNKRLESIFSILGSIGDAERSAQNVDSILSNLDQFANGLSSIRTNFDFSALSDIGTANKNDVVKQANQAGNLIGPSASGLVNDTIEASKVVKDLPSILERLINRNQLDDGNRDLALELKDAIGEGFAQNLVSSAFGKVVGGSGNSTEFIKRFQQDPVSIVKELQSAVDPIVAVLRDSGPRIVDQFNQYIDGLEKVRQNFFHSLEGLGKLIDIEQSKADLNRSFTGKTATFGENQEFDRQRFSLLGGNSDVTGLGLRLKAAQGNISSLSEQRKGTSGGVFKNLTDAIEKNVIEAEQVTKALEFSADVNSRLASTQQEIQRLEKTRELKTNLAKDFVFGGPEAKREIIKGLVGAKQVQENLNSGKNAFNGLSPQLIQSARNVFETFSDSKIFGGKDGKTILNDVTSQALGTDISKLNPEEENTINIGKQILDNSKLAQEILNANLTDNNDKFLKGLGEKFDGFFVNLNKNIAGNQADSRVKTGESNDIAVANIADKIDALKLIGKKTGINVNNKDDISKLRNAVVEFRKGEDTVKDSGNISGAAQRFANRGFKGTKELESHLGAGFTKEFNDRQNSTFTKLFGQSNEDFVNKKVLDEIVSRNAKRNEIRTGAEDNFPGISKKIDDGGIVKNLKDLEDGLKIISEGETLNKLRQQRNSIEQQERASGGPIFKRKGTDTVPAMTTDGQPFMLTPGEMVMNRRAVGKYGPELKRMNYAANGGYFNESHNNLFEQTTKNKQQPTLPPGISYNYTQNNEINKTFPYKHKGVKYASLRAAELARDGDFGTDNPTLIELRKKRGVIRADGSSYHRNSFPLSIRGNPSVQNYRQVYQRASRNFQNAKAQQDFNVNRPKPIDANPSQSRPVDANPSQSNPVSRNPLNNQVAPGALQDFSKAVDKLNGMKMELVISGTLNVNISEGNFSDKVKEHFKTAVQAYVDDKVTTSINQLIGEAGLAVLPRTVGQKEGKS